MGSLPRPPALTEDEIVARYRAGEARGMIGLRARVSDARVKEILLAAGIELRSQREVVALIATGRRRRHRPSRPRWRDPLGFYDEGSETRKG